VLSNTHLDNNTKRIQVALGKNRYQNAEYDDRTVDNLMRYFEAETYEELERFLKNSHIPSFN
jgi:hypothetical protein